VTELDLLGIPAAPMLLDAVTPTPPPELAAGIDRLRAEIAEALAGPPPGPTVVVVAGVTLAVAAPTSASLASYGHPQASAPVTPADAAGRLGSALGVEVETGVTASGDDAVLALHLVAHTPAEPVVVVRLPPDPAAVDAVADALAAGSWRIVTATDLAATLTLDSPGYIVDGADDWDRAALAAVRDVDLAGLDAIGPGEAERVEARGWAPLRLLVALASRDGQRPSTLHYDAPRGVGQLVVRMSR
jgi:hypothetical protein